MDVPRSNRYYLAVAFGLIALVAIAYGGAAWLIHRTPHPGPAMASVPSAAIGTPVAPTVPANIPVVPIPTIAPQPFPTPIADGPTPIATSAPLWPMTRVTDPQSHDVYWMAPPNVVAQVRKDFEEMDAYYRAHIFNLTPADERQFYVEPLLDSVMQEDRIDEQRGEARGRADLLRPALRIMGFSANGRSVQVAQEFHGEPVPIYDRATHRLLREERSPVGVAITTLIYDTSDHRWKASATTFVPAPPGVH